MKKLLIIAILFAFSGVLFAQTNSEDYYKQQIKDRKEMLKYSEKVLKTKINKQAKASAKALKKEGWKPFPGAAPLENQINERLHLSTLMDGILPKYLFGEGTGVSNLRQIATKSAEVSSRAAIAASIKAEFDEVIDQSLNGQQRNAEENAMLNLVAENTTYVSQVLRYVRPIVQMYRELADGKIEVNVIMYTETAQAKNALFEKMESQNAALREKLDQRIADKK